MFMFRLDKKKIRELKRKGMVQAIEQVNLTIIKRSFGPGEIIVKTTISEDDFTYLQILITPDSNAKQINCGSSLLDLSIAKNGNDPDSLVKKCEVSS